MKKKFTFLLTALLLITGTAMRAQTVVTAINTAKRYTLECRSGYAHSDARYIADDGTTLNGNSAAPTYISFEDAGTAGAYYIKSDITGKYLNHNTTSTNGLSLDAEKVTVWTLGVPSHTAGVVTFTIGNDKYLNNNGTDGACTNLKVNNHSGGPGENNACSLWEMCEYDRPVDYTPHVTGERTQNTGRQVTGISIASEAFAGETANTYTLTDEERRQVYLDLTDRVTMKVKSGEAVASTLSKNGNWVNAYVYVDYEADGFTASLAVDGYSPAEDLVSYSFYSGDDNNDNNGHNYNSVGAINDRNTVELPSFSAPATAGTYRMRFKMDWNSIDPAGDQNSTHGDFTTNGGAIIDVMLEVEEAEVLSETDIKRRELNAYINDSYATLFTDPLPLQTGDASGTYYLSATQYGDAPISAAIDNDPSTHYGSTWQSVVGSTHYWQVDLGEGVTLSEFVFSYITRNGNDIPTRLNVKGSADGATFTEMVSLGSELPTNGGATYTSNVIDNSKGYRYIRFEVPSTVNNYSAAGNPEQEVTISIAEFSMKTTSTSLSDKEQALLAAIAEAQKVVDNEAATIEELNEAYKNLKIATVEKPVYPFTITTDDASPVLYTIRSGRGAQWWYTYDATDGMISLAPFTRDDAQYWYFKEVITEDYDYALQLYPYLGGGKAMSYQNTSNGPAKVVAQAPGTEGYTNYWRFVTTGGGTPYGLQTYDKANYLSNFGGTSNKMGMWTGSPAADGGTAMYISEAHTWTIIPSEYEAGIKNAESEIHELDDLLTIYTSYCHWSDELTIYNSPYKGKFYSNELYAAIKSITFSASCEGEETLLVYGSNDGETWALVDEVAVPCGEGVADFTGTAYNFFKVETKGFNNVNISKLVIKVDPTVELPLIVDEPAFNVAGGNLYEPIRLQLSSEQGATIYWSTDGENYEEYTAEIKIDTTCTIYAYAEIDGVESEVTSETYVVAAEYENIAAMQAAVEATEEGTPVIINLEAIITSVGDKQITIKDNTGEVLVSDNYMPTEYAVRDTLTGKMRGVYKLVKGTPTVCELDYAYLRHKIFVLTEAPKLEGQYFTVGNATSILKEYTWYLLRNVGRNAYVNETDVDLRMLPATSITSMAAADDNLGVLFHLEKSENGEDLYTICSGKGNYFTIAQSSSAISATAVDYLIKNISGNTFYMQDPTSNVVVDGNAAGGTFVGWGTTVPTSTGGNNAYQFMEVEFVDAAKAASIVKASGILNELQQEYGLVTDASQYSSNAVEPTEGSLAALLDNNYTTFFHSTWSQTVEGTHYLQAEVSKPTQSLFFYFKKRSQNNNNRPTDITILGSNDGVNFTEITTIKSGLPTEASVLDYTSNTIKAKQVYKHFRFMVNATSGDTGNTQFFTFSEFYILPGESAIRNVLTTANALLGANVTDKNFDKLVAAFDAAYAKLKGEDEKPVTPTGKKVVYDLDVERTAGMGYAADEYPIATSELAALLGGNTLENATIWGVNPDGTFVADAMATYDGWRDAQGAFAYWGETAAVCAKLFQEEASYLVELCTFPDNDPVAGTKYTATWALTAGNDTVVINTNITFVAPKELNINSLEVVSTITVEHNENAAVAYSGNTAAFDAAAAAKALGIATLDEADQYILNVTTGNLVVNTTDGWRDANGDAAGWGNAGGVCVKIQVPSSGSVDYIGCYDETHAVGETYTAKWAFVHGSKAVVVEVVITFIDASGIGNIHVDGPITVYTISGQAIQTTMDGMQSLERGIYIVNGKKVVIK